MKKSLHTFMAAVTAFSAALTATAQEAPFKSFARTKDSLMHIAYYDNKIDVYKAELAQLQQAYQQLPPADKEKYKETVSESQFMLACAYARQGNRQQALMQLQQSRYSNIYDLEHEKALDGLRSDPMFQRHMMMQKMQRSNYVQVLATGGSYTTAAADFPAFTYQSPAEEHLVALRKQYNLDSIAGYGNDVAQIINLMKWVHYLVPHNGSKPNPETKNALSMIKECRNGVTLNCRGLAIMLNEVYLAAGFRAKYVTCLPKDTTDKDCHVINAVWSPSKQKWLWMDPTFMAYVMDERGELLSIEEVRERLIRNRPLILNPDANRNHYTPQTREDYLGNYMAKNLYKLEAPVSSEYNYETKAAGIKRAYVQLVPGDTIRATGARVATAGSNIHYTSNAKQFWAAPPAPERLAHGEVRKQSEYEAAMREFFVSYNNQSLKCNAIADGTKWWNESLLQRTMNNWGKLKEVKYLGQEEDNENVALFKTVYEKSTHCMAVSLDDNGKFGQFRMMTYSPYIDWLLAKDLDKDKKK